MMTYLISYELSNPNQQKQLLSEAIMSLGESWARPLDNTWYIRTKEREERLKEKLGRIIKGDDAFLIQTVDEEVTLVNTSMRWFKQKSSNYKFLENKKYPEFQYIVSF
ncbi:MAG: hypothetical protein ACKOW3_06975 [Hyphomicrobium sp.]